MRAIGLALVAVLAAAEAAPGSEDRCTAIVVGAKASTTGSPMTTHTNDCSSCDFRIVKVPRQTHAKDAVHDVVLASFDYPRYVGEARGPAYRREHVDTRFFNWSDSPAIGSIPEAPTTYAYIDGAYGIINEHQVAIGESTCGARFASKPRSQGGEALFDVTELSRIALQRATTAREAITIMGTLAFEHGYYGAEWEGEGVYGEAGEALTVTDTTEAWMFHILPDDTGRSAIWAAQRVPDDHVSVVANQFVIRALDLNNTRDFLASPNVHDVAIRHQLWDPRGGELLDFSRVYAQPREETHQFYSTRRMWRILTLANPGLALSPDTDVFASDYPFSVPAAAALSPHDIMRFQRDHYEGTPFDMTQGPAAGPFGDPDRYDAAVTADVSAADLRAGHFERAVSIFRASYSFVSVANASDPDAALLWFGPYAPHATVYSPVFVQTDAIPGPLATGSLRAFDRASAFWAHALIGNWAARFYRYAHPYVDKAQRELEASADRLQREVSARAAAVRATEGPDGVRRLLTEQTALFADESLAAAVDLFEYLVTVFHDGYEMSGFFTDTLRARALFYPRWWLERVGFFNATTGPGGDAAASASGPSTTVSYATTAAIAVLAGAIGVVVGRRWGGANTGGYKPIR